MIRHIGDKVQDRPDLIAYAEKLWSSQEFQDWKAHMRQDVADSLSSPSKPEGYPAQA